MILVTGGCRSGKSEFAEKLVTDFPGENSEACCLYLATAKITDEEMAQRVEKHRIRRGARWETFEGYRDLDRVSMDGYGGILLDSVTTMTTNLLFDFIGDVDWETFSFENVDFEAAGAWIMKAFERLCASAQNYPLVFVTDEIGLGVVPETCLGRAFRDILGTVNQYLAKQCAEVYFVVSGIPMQIKARRPDKTNNISIEYGSDK